MNENEMKMIKEMATHMVDYCDRFQMCPYDADSNVTCDICKARSLYNANCRIIADDEIVIKKSEYETLKAQNDTLELSVKDLRYRNAQFSEANKLFAKRNDELLDELQGATAIKEKTAKEILQELKNKQIFMLADEVFGRNTAITQKINELAEKYGIELE